MCLSPPDADTQVTTINTITSEFQMEPTKADILAVRNISMTICEKQYETLATEINSSRYTEYIIHPHTPLCPVKSQNLNLNMLSYSMVKMSVLLWSHQARLQCNTHVPDFCHIKLAIKH